MESHQKHWTVPKLSIKFGVWFSNKKDTQYSDVCSSLNTNLQMYAFISNWLKCTLFAVRKRPNSDSNILFSIKTTLCCRKQCILGNIYEQLAVFLKTLQYTVNSIAFWG